MRINGSKIGNMIKFVFFMKESGELFVGVVFVFKCFILSWYFFISLFFDFFVKIVFFFMLSFFLIFIVCFV